MLISNGKTTDLRINNNDSIRMDNNNSKYYIQTQQLKECMCLRTDEFVKEPIRIKNKKSQEVTSNTIAEIKAQKYYMSMSC